MSTRQVASASEQEFTSIRVGEQPFTLDFHPSRKLVGVGLITGQIKLYDYSGEKPEKAASSRPHTESCRSLRFSADGNGVWTVGSDRLLHLRDLATNKPEWRRKNAHDASINAMTLLSEVGVATGDDDGAIKLWDIRQKSLSMKFQENSDFVADMLYTEHKGNSLAVAGGDGRLSVFDLRAGRLLALSDPLDDEILSLTLLKNGRKLLCGCQSGVVGIFSWGDFGDVSDRLVGHPESVDAMVPLTGDTMITGSSDGMLRLVGVHPNKVLGLVGDHDDMPVERLAIDHSSDVLGSCSHDNSVRLWDIAYLRELRYDAKGIKGQRRKGEDGAASDSDDTGGEEGEEGEKGEEAAEEDGEEEGEKEEDGEEEGEEEEEEEEGEEEEEETEEVEQPKGRGKKVAAVIPATKKARVEIEQAQPAKRVKEFANKNAAIKIGADFFADM